MIVGRATQTFSQCFVELDDAVTAIDREAGRDRVVAFNAHRGEAPPGAVIWNLENVNLQVMPDAFPGREVWDFSARNVEAWTAAGRQVQHVPVGWHRSMERFRRAPVPDIDVVFAGAINPRRAAVLNELQARGLRVVIVPQRFYGRQRDAILARAKLALNMLFYPEGTFPALRVAHLVANRVPVLTEFCPEQWGFIETTSFDEIVDRTHFLVSSEADEERREMAAHAFRCFAGHPMVLPS